MSDSILWQIIDRLIAERDIYRDSMENAICVAERALVIAEKSELLAGEAIKALGEVGR